MQRHAVCISQCVYDERKGETGQVVYKNHNNHAQYYADIRTIERPDKREHSAPFTTPGSVAFVRLLHFYFSTMCYYNMDPDRLTSGLAIASCSLPQTSA